MALSTCRVSRVTVPGHAEAGPAGAHTTAADTRHTHGSGHHIKTGQGYCGLTNFIDQLAIFCEKFYTPHLAGEITHVQCAEKTPKKNAQA
jgi:hypothetical protein